MFFVLFSACFSQFFALGENYSVETNVVVRNTNFISLSGTNGGGVYYENEGGKITLISCFFHLCQASNDGGGVFLTSSDMIFESLCFCKCKSANRGDAARCYSTNMSSFLTSISLCPISMAGSTTNSIQYWGNNIVVSNLNSSYNQIYRGQYIFTYANAFGEIKYFTFIGGNSTEGASMNVHGSPTQYSFSKGNILNTTTKELYGLLWTNNNCRNLVVSDTMFIKISGTAPLVKCNTDLASLAKLVRCQIEYPSSLIGGAPTASCVFATIAITNNLKHLNSWECMNDQYYTYYLKPSFGLYILFFILTIF